MIEFCEVQVEVFCAEVPKDLIIEGDVFITIALHCIEEGGVL